MNKLKYQFYFYYKENGQKHIVTNKVCKYPKMTNVYKQLLNSLNREFIHSFGFESIELINN